MQIISWIFEKLLSIIGLPLILGWVKDYMEAQELKKLRAEKEKLLEEALIKTGNAKTAEEQENAFQDTIDSTKP